MPTISSPSILQVRNAVGGIVVPVTRVLQFQGSVVVTQVGPGRAVIDGTDTGATDPWDIHGNGGPGLMLGTTTADAWPLLFAGIPAAGFDDDGNFYVANPSADNKNILSLDVNPQTNPGVAAPIGSIGLVAVGAVGTMYQKTGAADTAWTLFSANVAAVNSLNALTGAVVLAAGTNVGLNIVGQTITISAANPGVPSVNGITAAVTLVAGTNISLGVAGANITVNCTLPGWRTDGNALTGGAPATPNEAVGSTNDYDLVIIRDGIEIMRVIPDGLLIGESASSNATPAKLELASAVNGDIFERNFLTGLAVTNSNRLGRNTTAGAVTSNFQVNIGAAADSNFLFKVRIAVMQIGGGTGAVGDGAAFEKDIFVNFNLATNTGTVINQQNIYTYAIDPGITATITSNGSGFRIACAGVAGRNLHWGIRIESISVA